MRLIDADKLLEACGKTYITTANNVITMIAEDPTIAINIVENGNWKPLWFDEDDSLFNEPPSDYKCSVCAGIVARSNMFYNYCPYCGAKMD